MPKLNKIIFASIASSIMGLMLSPALMVSSASTSSTESGSMRDPFALELPDIGTTRITAPEATIPTADIHSIRLLVRRPYSDSINYGKIYTSINGESAGTIQNVKAGRDGYIVTCDIESKPHLFRLRNGKNVIEISATDRNNRSYYASYVLLTGGKQAGDSSAQGATIETISVPDGSDRQPPVVNLIEPKGAVRLAGPGGAVRIHGVVSDDSGAVTSVTVNGQAVSLAQSTGSRGLFVRPAGATGAGEMAFDRSFAIPTGSSSIIIEARDRAGNTTRLSIPLRRREAAVSSRFSGRKFALVIGVSHYKYQDGGLSNLAYADADARAMRDFLQRREGGGFAASDILYLENEQATIEAVRGALKTFLPKAGPNDLMMIFIAGHGAPDPYAPQNLYFLMNNTKVANMADSALPMDELREMLEHNVRAERVLVFVDTCHSAGLSGEKLVQSRGLENNLTNLYAQRLYREKGRAILTSSDVNEVSQESEQWGGGHGIFTLALLDGLRGEADANGDHLVTAGELFDYVRDRVRVETAFHQNPRAQAGLSADLTLAVAQGK